MSKHTPGPWRYMAGTHSHYDSEGKAIARVYGPRGIDCSRRDANARLIAAAPELLEALCAALHLIETISPFFRDDSDFIPYEALLQMTKGDVVLNARAVIAKAGGNDD